MEIERKYLIHELPKDLEAFPSRKIEQAYLCIAPVVRIRRQDNDYYLTYKGKGMMMREEYKMCIRDRGKTNRRKRYGNVKKAVANSLKQQCHTIKTAGIQAPCPHKGLNVHRHNHGSD